MSWVWWILLITKGGLLLVQIYLKFIKKADILVFPTLYDIQGKVGLEAMAFGVPVIACDVGGVSSVIKHEKNGLLVKVADSDEIYDAIIRIIADPELRKK